MPGPAWEGPSNGPHLQQLRGVSLECCWLAIDSILDSLVDWPGTPWDMQGGLLPAGAGSSTARFSYLRIKIAFVLRTIQITTSLFWGRSFPAHLLCISPPCNCITVGYQRRFSAHATVSCACPFRVSIPAATITAVQHWDSTPSTNPFHSSQL